MPFEINPAIPMSYQYGSSMMDQMKDAMTIADLLDKRKETQRKLAEEQSLRSLVAPQAQSALESYYAPLPEVPVAPVAPQPYTPQIMGWKMADEGTLPRQESKLISPMPFQGAPAPAPYSPEEVEQLPEVQQATEDENRLAQDQFAKQQAEYQTAQAARQQAEATKIPADYAWMQPNEYEHMLRLQKISDTESQGYLDKLADRKLKIAQAGTAETKSKDLRDFQIGQILSSLYDGRDSVSPEENQDAIQALISVHGMTPVEARSSVDNAKSLIQKYQASPAMLATQTLAEKRKVNEAAQKLAQEKFDLDKQEFALKQKTAGVASAKDLLELEKLRAEIQAIKMKETGEGYDTSYLGQAIDALGNHRGFAVGFAPRRMLSLAAGSPERDFVINHGNVINQIALMARSKIKGQGQVSDFEGKMLKNAATSLDLNMSPVTYRAELARIKRYVDWKNANPKITVNSQGEADGIMGARSAIRPKQPNSAPTDNDPLGIR